MEKPLVLHPLDPLKYQQRPNCAVYQRIQNEPKNLLSQFIYKCSVLLHFFRKTISFVACGPPFL